GPRLPDRGRGGAAAGGGRAGPRPRPELLHGAGGGLRAAPRPPGPVAGARRVPRLSSRGRLLRDDRDRRPRLGGRRGLRAPPRGGDRSGGRARLVLLRRSRGRTAAGPL